MQDLIKKTIEEVTSLVEDRSLCEDPTEGEFFCLAGSENLGVTDIYKGDGFDLIHQHGGEVHLSDITPEEEDTAIPKGSKKIKKTVLKPRLDKGPFTISPTNLSEGLVVTPIKIEGKMVSNPNTINEETDIFGQGLMDPIEPEEFEGDEKEWDELVDDVEDDKFEVEPEYSYEGGKTDPEAGFVAPSAEVTDNICKVKGFCEAQGPITFGQLKSLVEEATSKRIQADMGRGVFKTLWRIIPFFVPQILLAAVGITLTRAINKIVTPALKDTRGYKEWWGKVVLKAMDIAEGDYIPDIATGDDPLSKVFFISDGLLQMIRDKYKLKFARYVADVATAQPDNKPVPEWFVENLLRDYLNQKFLLSPPLPIKQGTERQDLINREIEEDLEQWGYKDDKIGPLKEGEQDREDGNDGEVIDDTPFTKREVSILKALHSNFTRVELTALSSGEPPQTQTDRDKKFWGLMKLFGIEYTRDIDRDVRVTVYPKWANDNWTEDGDYGSIENPHKEPLKWYNVYRDESGSQIEYKSGEAEVLAFDEEDAEETGQYNFWDWGGEMENYDYGDYEAYDSEITDIEFLRLDEQDSISTKDKKILDLTPQIFDVLDDNFILVPHKEGELYNGTENLGLYSFDMEMFLPIEDIYNPVKPLLDVVDLDQEYIDVFIKIISDWVSNRMFTKPNYDLNEGLNDLIYREVPREKHVRRMAKDLGNLTGFPLDKWKNMPPPKNESDTTEEEIEYLEDIQVDKNLVDSADEIRQHFTNFLSPKGLDYPKEELKEVMRGVKAIILRLKYHYNRPRPFQIAQAKGLELNAETLQSSSSPSYPSGHATQGRFLARYLSDLYPEYREELMQIGEDIAYSRNMAKVHYPSDSTFGKLLGDDMYDYVYQPQEELETELDEWCPMGNPNKCSQVRYNELPDTLQEQINTLLLNSFGQTIKISLAESFFLKNEKVNFNTLGFNIRYFQPIRKTLIECEDNFETLLVEMKQEVQKIHKLPKNLNEETIRELILTWYPNLMVEKAPFTNKKKTKTENKEPGLNPELTDGDTILVIDIDREVENNSIKYHIPPPELRPEKFTPYSVVDKESNGSESKYPFRYTLIPEDRYQDYLNGDYMVERDTAKLLFPWLHQWIYADIPMANKVDRKTISEHEESKINPELMVGDEILVVDNSGTPRVNLPELYLPYVVEFVHKPNKYQPSDAQPHYSLNLLDPPDLETAVAQGIRIKDLKLQQQHRWVFNPGFKREEIITEPKKSKVNPELEVDDIIRVIEVDGEHARMPKRWGVYRVVKVGQSYDEYYDITPHPEVESRTVRHYKELGAHHEDSDFTLYRGDTWIYADVPMANKVDRKTISENWRDTSWEDDDGKITIGDITDYLGNDIRNISVSDLQDKLGDNVSSVTQGEERIMKADLQYPIILVQKDGEFSYVLDGNHRLAKAIMTGEEYIKAKVLYLDDKNTPKEFKRLLGGEEVINETISEQKQEFNQPLTMGDIIRVVDVDKESTYEQPTYPYDTGNDSGNSLMTNHYRGQIHGQDTYPRPMVLYAVMSKSMYRPKDRDYLNPYWMLWPVGENYKIPSNVFKFREIILTEKDTWITLQKHKSNIPGDIEAKQKEYDDSGRNITSRRLEESKNPFGLLGDDWKDQILKHEKNLSTNELKYKKLADNFNGVNVTVPVDIDDGEEPVIGMSDITFTIVRPYIFQGLRGDFFDNLTPRNPDVSYHGKEDENKPTPTVIKYDLVFRSVEHGSWLEELLEENSIEGREGLDARERLMELLMQEGSNINKFLMEDYFKLYGITVGRMENMYDSKQLQEQTQGHDEHKQSKLNPQLMIGDEILVVSIEGIHDFGAPELYKPYVVVGIKYGGSYGETPGGKWRADDATRYYQIEPIGMTDEERTGAMLAGGGRMKPLYIFPPEGPHGGSDKWILRPGFLRGELTEEKPGLWANIRAKRAKVGKKGMAKKGSKAYKTAKKAGDKINKEVDEGVRTLSKARRAGIDSYYPKSAVKANPQRFRKYTRDKYINEDRTPHYPGSPDTFRNNHNDDKLQIPPATLVNYLDKFHRERLIKELTPSLKCIAYNCYDTWEKDLENLNPDNTREVADQYCAECSEELTDRLQDLDREVVKMGFVTTSRDGYVHTGVSSERRENDYPIVDILEKPFPFTYNDWLENIIQEVDPKFYINYHDDIVYMEEETETLNEQNERYSYGTDLTPSLQTILKTIYLLMEFNNYEQFQTTFQKYFRSWNTETLGILWLTATHNIRKLIPSRYENITEMFNSADLPKYWTIEPATLYTIQYKGNESTEEWEDECSDDGYSENTGEECDCKKSSRYNEDTKKWEECDWVNDDDCDCDEFIEGWYDVYGYPLVEIQIMVLGKIELRDKLEDYTSANNIYEFFNEIGDNYIQLGETDTHFEHTEWEPWTYFTDGNEGEIEEVSVEELDVNYEMESMNNLFEHKKGPLNEQDGQLDLFPYGEWEWPVGWEEDDDYISEVKHNVPEPLFKKIMNVWDQNGIDFSIFKLLGVRSDSLTNTYVLKRYVQNTTKPIPVSYTFGCNDLKELFDRNNNDYDLSYIAKYLCGDDSFWDHEDWYNYEWDDYMTDAINESNWKTISEIFGGVSQSDAEDILNRSYSSEEVDELTEKYEEEIDEIRHFIVWAYNDEHEYAIKNGMRADIEDKLAEHFQHDGQLHTDNNGSKSWTIQGDLRDYVNDQWDNTDTFEYHTDHISQPLEDMMLDYVQGNNLPHALFSALMEEEYAFWEYCEGKRGECLQPETKWFDGYWHPDVDINESLSDRLGELTYETTVTTPEGEIKPMHEVEEHLIT